MQHIVINPLPPDDPLPAEGTPAASPPRGKLNWLAIAWWWRWFVGLLGFALAAALATPVLHPIDLKTLGIGAFPVMLILVVIVPASLILVGLSLVHSITLLLLLKRAPLVPLRLIAALVLVAANLILASWVAAILISRRSLF